MATITRNQDYYEKAAKAALLRYVSDSMPGIRRKRKGKGFAYYDAKGELIDSKAIIERIRKLVIPPAYRNVWICPLENGHLQATGMDDKNRKQYRYHPDWDAVRDSAKFERVIAFGMSLPTIRAKVQEHLKDKDITRTRVLAAMVSIMDDSYIRIGNPIYKKAHGTYGLTTLRKKHITIEKTEATLVFEGKNHTRWTINLQDRKLIKLLKACEELPGYELFKYIDEDGSTRLVQSEDFNAYLQEISGEVFTAKDFRTWAACKEAFTLLCETELPDTKKACQIAYRNIIQNVATLLGHTPAVCKKSYLHPLLEEIWLQGKFDSWKKKNYSPSHTEEENFLRWWKLHVKP